MYILETALELTTYGNRDKITDIADNSCSDLSH